MPYRLIAFDQTTLPILLAFVTDVYASIAPKDLHKYPVFTFSKDVDDAGKRKKFYSAFVTSAEFAGCNIRQAFALVDDDGKCIFAVGVTRFENWPSWSVAWVLSHKIGVRFMATFRIVMEQLCKLHESIGINEFFVTYPYMREEAYSKIMLPFRDRYYTFVECVIPANKRSPYRFIFNLMGQALYQYDISIRRYIRRRDNTLPESEGGHIVKPKYNSKSD